MNYLDTNIIAYAIENHPKYGKACKKILLDIELNKIEIHSSLLVLIELINVLKKINKELIKQDKKPLDISKNIDAVLSLPLIWLDIDFLIVRKASQYEYNISGIDYIHIATMEINSIKNIISADDDFDKVEFIKRIDPLDY